MACRNFFSGVEGDSHWDAAVDAGAEHCLMSYLYLQKTGDGLLHRRKKKHPHVKIMVDSGAHTLQTNAHKAPYVSWKMADYEKYVTQYVKWLRKNKKYIHVAVELDIAYPLNICTGRKGDDPYGNQIVEKWRRTIFAPLQDEGIEIIYVFHQYNGMQGWEQMCEEYSYVGLPGELSNDSDFNKYISVARRYSTRIHGFAATKQIDFSTWPWFSVDSTTWKAGERYGTIMDWDVARQKLKVYEKDQRRVIYEKLKRLGYKADAIIADTDYKEVTKYTLFSMVSMEKFYQNRFKDRVFYYDLRLPPPNRVLLWKDSRVLRRWKQFDPVRVFAKHSEEKSTSKLRDYLMAIAAVQNNRMPSISKNSGALDFLRDYWPAQMQKTPFDMKEFKKEVSVLTSPRNREPQERTTAEDYIASNNAPRSRTNREWRIEELEWEPSRFQFLKTMKQPLARAPLALT